MKWRRYPKYRDSGIEWLGEVPGHWHIDRLKWTVKSCRNGIWGDEPNGDDDLLCIRVADFDRQRFLVSFDRMTLRSLTPAERRNRLLSKGDLLLEKSGGGDLQPVGAVVSYDHSEPAVCSNFVARMEIADDCDSRYQTYLHAHLYAGRVNTRSIKQTTGIQNLDADAYLSEPVCYPCNEEQHAISAFLDRETARIDALIEKKQRQIELLKEKRAALISQAVTKGLDPNVKMKDSGIEWLGEVPEHWEVVRLKFLVCGMDQGSSPQCDSFPAEPDEWGVLKTGCVNGAVFREEENKALPKYIDPITEHQVHPGDVLMSRASGSLDLIGSAALITRKPTSRLLLSDKIYRFRLKKKVITAEFFVYALGSPYCRHQVRVVVSGAEGLANNIAKSDILEFQLLVPPLTEQLRISAQLARKVESCSDLIRNLDASIVFLREYRTALISAAVTGKIDVWEEAA